MAAEKEGPKVAGTNNVPLHHETASFVLRCEELGMKAPDTLSPVEARKQVDDTVSSLAGPCDFKGSTTDMKVPSEDVPDGIPIRIYKPNKTQETLQIIVYVHGGCQIVGSIQSHDIMCKTIVNQYSCIMVSVGYRLAPEHKLPAGMDDVETVTKWVLENRQKIGGSKDSQVGVAGDSAGGQTAASVANRIPDLAFQILVYPMVDLTYSFQSIQVFPHGPGITTDILQWALQQFKDSSDANNPRYSPILQTSFEHLPPALILLAEIDALRDEGRDYAKKLIGAGVNIDFMEFKGTLHGFFHLPGSFPETCRVAYRKLECFLRSIKNG